MSQSHPTIRRVWGSGKVTVMYPFNANYDKKNVLTHEFSPLCVHVRLLLQAPARPAGCSHRNRAFWNSAAGAPGASCLSLVCLWRPLNAPWCGCHQRNNKQTQLLIRQNPKFTSSWVVHGHATHSLSWTMFLSRRCWLAALSTICCWWWWSGFIWAWAHRKQQDKKRSIPPHCTLHLLLLILLRKGKDWESASSGTQLLNIYVGHHLLTTQMSSV